MLIACFDRFEELFLTGKEDLAGHHGGAHVCDPPSRPLCDDFLLLFPRIRNPLSLHRTFSDTFALEGRYYPEFLPRVNRPYNFAVCSFNRQKVENLLGGFHLFPLFKSPNGRGGISV